MVAVRADTLAWGWLRRSLQALSSPGMAVASGLALVMALAGALIITLNAPSRGDQGIAPESTIPAVAVAPLPTEIPTTEPEPTATRAPLRTVAPAPAKEATKEPTPRPTATRVAIVAAAEPTLEAGIAPAVIEEPMIEPVAEDPTLAMVEEPIDTGASAELAQAAEPVPSDEGVSEADAALAVDDSGTTNDDSGTTKEGRQERVEEPVVEPVATRAVPGEAIAALETAGTTTDIYLPPAPPLPMPPSQAFLPITPTPVSDGTPTPEPETQADVPQLADDWSDEPSLTALIPESPEVTDAAVVDATLTETDEDESRKQRDRSSQDGKSQENQQSAYTDDAMGWSLAPVDLGQSAALLQTTDETTGGTTETPTAEPATATEATPQYDPATGLEIDPATGLLIDPTTGYLLDLVNGRIIDPRTGYLVHPMTGLLIDPATGAQLDPVTLAVVIPAEFGSETPEYIPGSDSMRGTIETVVDATYDDATYKVVPPTDGPTQPVGEIVVPTEAGASREIS
jgi:hypothetical protein